MKSVWQIRFLHIKEFTVASVERMDWGRKVRMRVTYLYAFAVVQVRDADSLDRSVALTYGVWFIFRFAW